MDNNTEMESHHDEVFLYSSDKFPENVQICELFPMVHAIGKVPVSESDHRVTVDEVINDFKLTAQAYIGINAIVGVKLSICAYKQENADYLVISCAGNPAVIGAVMKDGYFD